MATLIIHGTMTTRAARVYSWWHESYGSGGFLEGVVSGLREASGGNDVWKVGGRSVAEYPALKGGKGTFQTRDGHFEWSGLNQEQMRRGAGDELARYLSAVSELAPGEPIRIIAHSHGCNVVKAASRSRRLAKGVRVARAVFLGCPHFVAPAALMGKFPYRLNPEVFGAGSVLNLYSPKDSIQEVLAERLPSLWGGGLFEGFAPQASQEDQHRPSRALYTNRAIATQDSGKAAHSALHGNLAGRIAGNWLAGRDFWKTVAREPVIPAGDHGS